MTANLPRPVTEADLGEQCAANHPWALSFGGTTFLALPERALWWPERRALIVADLHLEKGSALARTGQMLPPYDSIDTLTRLHRLAAEWDAATIYAVGDSFHDAAARRRLSPPAAAALEALESDVRCVWIEGNHDRRDPDGMLSHVTHGRVMLTHEPVRAADAGLAQIVGHFHPKYMVAAQGHRVVRPCFLVSEALMILPAFGAYTGGLWAHDEAIQRHFATPPIAMVPVSGALLRFPVAR